MCVSVLLSVFSTVLAKKRDHNYVSSLAVTHCSQLMVCVAVVNMSTNFQSCISSNEVINSSTLTSFHGLHSECKFTIRRAFETVAKDSCT